MFKRVLIANRGEIALRIQRACRELEIEPVVVYSAADAEALHVQLAEEAYCIGPARAADSYLNMDAILTVAKAARCDAIHPGYGFLSENDQFADACAEAGIAFIGPSGDVIRAMGNKAAARALMQKAGVPVVPGSDGAVADAAEAKALADKIGYPVLIKASAGGGGRPQQDVGGGGGADVVAAVAQPPVAAPLLPFDTDQPPHHRPGGRVLLERAVGGRLLPLAHRQRGVRRPVLRGAQADGADGVFFIIVVVVVRAQADGHGPAPLWVGGFRCGCSGCRRCRSGSRS